jgi:signal transduction histidine kinase/CheY-like chemotaxis protein
MDNLRSRGVFDGAGLSLVGLRLTRMKEANRELTGVIGVHGCASAVKCFVSKPFSILHPPSSQARGCAGRENRLVGLLNLVKDVEYVSTTPSLCRNDSFEWARLLDLFAQRLRCSSLTYFGPNTLATHASTCAKICCATALHLTKSIRLNCRVTIMSFRILHLEDHKDDAFFVEQALIDAAIPASIHLVRDPEAFARALEKESYDLILADNTIPGFNGLQAVRIARKMLPKVPFICLSGSADRRQVQANLTAGANDCIHKDNMWQVTAAVRQLYEKKQLQRHNQAMTLLVKAVQELSLARDLETVTAIVRRAARELTGADGATFVLRDGDCCYYADEDAISPLWKGQRFPMSTCISGWVMQNRQSVVIEDIYADERIPADAYRPTFVKSLVMVPIRTESPIGAIGNYWAEKRLPTVEEVDLLHALASTTAVAMENIQIRNELEARVKNRTERLEATNRELEAFSYAVSHDLGAPLRSVQGFSNMLQQKSAAKLDGDEKKWLERIQVAGDNMGRLIEDLMRLSKVVRSELIIEKINLSLLASGLLNGFAASAPERKVEVSVAPEIIVEGDHGLLRAAMENLLSNAWKYTAKAEQARIEVGVTERSGEPRAYYVRDNGAGFDMQNAEKLFQPFQRMHSEKEFAGNGIGLATVQRIIHRHGGKIWAEAEPGKGATFYFTLGEDVVKV